MTWINHLQRSNNTCGFKVIPRLPVLLVGWMPRSAQSLHRSTYVSQNLRVRSFAKRALKADTEKQSAVKNFLQDSCFVRTGSFDQFIWLASISVKHMRFRRRTGTHCMLTARHEWGIGRFRITSSCQLNFNAGPSLAGSRNAQGSR